MTRNTTSLVILLTLLTYTFVRADDPAAAASTTETRLREALKNAMLELRDDKKQIATLQVAQADSDKANADLQAKNDALNAQVVTLTKQAAADKVASDQAAADFNAKITDQAGQIDRLNDALKQWKDAYNQIAQIAKDTEAARVKFAVQAVILQRTVDDREGKNLALYKLGNEILTRYKEFSLGDAIGAKEPFVGATRVKLENLVQDYKNKLLDQAITTGPTPSTSPAPVPIKTADSTSSGKPPAKP